MASPDKKPRGLLRTLFGPTPPELRRSLGWALWGGIVPAVAAGAIIFGALDLPSALNAAHGHGIRGTMVVERRQYHESLRTGTHCSGSLGTFTSSDGAIKFDDASLDGVCSVPIGNAVNVFYEGHRPIVYATGSKEWILISSLMLVSGIYLVVWALVVVRTVKDRRHRAS